MAEIEEVAGDLSFDDQMQALSAEAERRRQDTSKEAQKDWFVKIAQLLKPMAVGIESLGRSTSEHNQQILRLIQTVAEQTLAFDKMDQVKQEVAKLIEVEVSNQRMFDAMHVEMRGYKDGFLFEAMQKPFIKDVLVVHDDLNAILSQTREQQQALGEAVPAGEGIRNIADNLENAIHMLLEVLNRMDVTKMDPATGILDKRLHKVVGFEEAEDEVEDGSIARSVRPGFFWKDRVIRPEEVILKRKKN